MQDHDLEEIFAWSLKIYNLTSDFVDNVIVCSNVSELVQPMQDPGKSVFHFP